VPGSWRPSRLRGRAAQLRGRRGECQVLDRLIDAVRAGESRALVVRGEPGVGKTALLDYVVEQASGCRVARATGVQSEMELAFAAVRSCARRCWIASSVSRFRSVMRCGPRSASVPARRRTGSSSGWWS
jgi:predicted ATPase